MASVYVLSCNCLLCEGKKSNPAIESSNRIESTVERRNVNQI
jgi:hypothetical protein